MVSGKLNKRSPSKRNAKPATNSQTSWRPWETKMRKLQTKQLPTTKWRRDRRARLSGPPGPSSLPCTVTWHTPPPHPHSGHSPQSPHSMPESHERLHTPSETLSIAGHSELSCEQSDHFSNDSYEIDRFHQEQLRQERAQQELNNRFPHPVREVHPDFPKVDVVDIREHPELVRQNPHLLRDHPELLTEHPELIRQYPELIKEHPELVKEHPQLVKHYPEIIRDFPDILRLYPELIREHPDLICFYPELVQHYPDLVREHPELIKHFPDLIREHPGMVRYYPELLKNHPEFIKQYPELVHHPDIAKHYPDVIRQHPGPSNIKYYPQQAQVATERTEQASQQPERPASRMSNNAMQRERERLHVVPQLETVRLGLEIQQQISRAASDQGEHSRSLRSVPREQPGFSGTRNHHADLPRDLQERVRLHHELARIPHEHQFHETFERPYASPSPSPSSSYRSYSMGSMPMSMQMQMSMSMPGPSNLEAEMTPLDMTVPRVNRGSPPSYSQAVAGSSSSHRPSVITHSAARSLSMCDPIIEEHFRRSLGSNYEQYLCTPQGMRQQMQQHASVASPRPSTSLQRSKTISAYPLGKVKYCSEAPRRSATFVVPQAPPPPPPHYQPVPLPIPGPSSNPDQMRSTTPGDHRPLLLRDTALSVDDHFAKALGDTWHKIKDGQPSQK